MSLIDISKQVQGLLAIANGGTGASTAQAAIDALTDVASATNEYVLTKDTTTGNAIWKENVSGATETVIIPVRNSSGALIPKGSPVYVSGYHLGSDRAEIDLCDADDPATMPCVGFTQTDLANNSNGSIITDGHLEGVQTNFSGWAVGDEIYVSTDPLTDRGLTKVKPTGTAEIQKVGTVLRVHATLGEIQTFIVGRTNDVPNIASANFWLGNASGVATAVTMSGDVTMDNAGVTTVVEGNVDHDSLLNYVANEHIDWTNATQNLVTTGTVKADWYEFTQGVASPSHSEGVLFWDDDNHTIAQYLDEADITQQIGQEFYVRVYNNSGSLISNGKACYVTGTEGVENRMTVDLAIANAEATSKVIGVATHDIENGTFGYLTVAGQANDLDTSAFAAGDVLYLSETSAGDLRLGKPPGGNYEIQVGFVNEVHATTGSVFVLLNEDLALAAGDAEEIITNARKGSAGTINPGEAVYVTGWNVGQGVVEVELADASSASTMPAFGIARSTITNSATGVLVVLGKEEGLDTSSWGVGDPLYVSETTGQLTNVKPTGTALIQKIATVLRSHASNGVIEITGAGRSNDLPNIADTKIWIGNGSGVPTEYALSGDATMTNAGVVTVVSASDTVAGKVELATIAETNTGTSTTLAVTPDGLDGWTGSAQVTTLGTIGTGTWQGTAIADGYISSAATWNAKIANVVEDTTPQLGGSLDVNGNKIVSVASGDIDIEPNGTGNVRLGNFTFDADQSVGAPEDNYVLTYDNGTGLISLEASAGGISGSGTVNYVSKWDGVSSQTDSTIFDNGTFIGLGYATASGSELVRQGVTRIEGGGSVELLTLANTTTAAYMLRVGNGAVGPGVGTASSIFVDAAAASGQPTHRGIYSQATSNTTTNNTGVYGLAKNSDGINRGIEGTIDGGWGAYTPTEITGVYGSIDAGAETSTSIDSQAGCFINSRPKDSQTGYGMTARAAVGTGTARVAVGGYLHAQTGDTKYFGRFVDGTEGAGKFVKCIDASGHANWATLVEADISDLQLYLLNVIEDTTPQLGGQLDVNGNAIGDGTLELLTFTESVGAVNHIDIKNNATALAPVVSAAGDDANIDLSLQPKGTGDVVIGNFTFDGDQTVGAGQDNYVLTYDNTAGKISLEASAGGGGSSWTKVTKSYTDFTAAATTESITLFTLTAGYILKGIMLKHTTAFAGTGWTANMTLEVGISGNTDKYLLASDVGQAVSDTVFFGGEQFDLINWGSNTTVQLTATSTGGNLSAGTAGAVEVYYLMEQVKS